MLTYFSFPENFASTTLGYAGDIFGDFTPYIGLIVGILIGAIVIKMVIGLLHHK